jgi:hypothetical protein
MIYCFDLDNTICITIHNRYEEALPIKERIQIINELYDQGHTIIIETARGCVSGKNWWYFTNEQLKSWGVKYHTLRTGVKWGADFFIDDKAINDKDFFKDGFSTENN